MQPPRADDDDGDEPAAGLQGRFRGLLHEELVGAVAVVLNMPRAQVEATLEPVPADSRNGWGFAVPRTVNAGYVEAFGRDFTAGRRG